LVRLAYGVRAESGASVQLREDARADIAHVACHGRDFVLTRFTAHPMPANVGIHLFNLYGTVVQI
jgi:hypothetical protein